MAALGTAYCLALMPMGRHLNVATSIRFSPAGGSVAL